MACSHSRNFSEENQSERPAKKPDDRGWQFQPAGTATQNRTVPGARRRGGPEACEMGHRQAVNALFTESAGAVLGRAFGNVQGLIGFGHHGFVVSTFAKLGDTNTDGNGTGVT